MEELKGFYISNEEAITREVENNEVRHYYLFREKDTNYPLEVIITEMPPRYTQPFHKHQTLQEVTIVLEGEAVGVIKENNKEEEYPIKPLSFYEHYSETHDFKGIVAAEDGTLLFVLEDKETGEISGGELDYSEGFNSKDAIHTIKNNTNEKTVTATVKFTTSEILRKNSKIFQEDKILD